MVNIAYLWPNKLHERNRARYQRAMSLSQSHDVKLIVRGTQPQNEEILSAVSAVYLSPSIERSNYLDHMTYYLYAVLVMAYLRLRGELDVIHTFPGPSTHLGICCKFVFGIDWVVDILDDPSVEHASLQGKRPVIKYLAYTLHVHLAKQDLRFADQVIVVGWSADEGLASIVVNRYNVPQEKVLPVPNGVDLDGTDPGDTTVTTPTNEFVLFYVGSIKQARGIDVLVRAFAKFNESIPDSRLKILGPVRQKQDKDAIEALVSDLNVGDSVDFPASRVAHTEVLEQMSRADICVLPLSEEIDNYKYTFPIKLFEYLAMSKPVVATRLDGISKVIENEYNGLLVEPGDARDMAQAFERFYRDETLRDTCRKNARESIREYDWTAVNRPVCRMYDEIVKAES